MLYIFIRNQSSKLQQYLPFTVLKRYIIKVTSNQFYRLQQYLPFTVLKLNSIAKAELNDEVATVLTVYGIETYSSTNLLTFQQLLVATVLTVYGIETFIFDTHASIPSCVATVLTVYGIETSVIRC